MKHAIRLASDEYGITGTAKELPSERDRNFHLTARTGEEYVLKIATESETKDILMLQNEAMFHLEKEIMCPQVIQSRTGENIIITEDKEGNEYFTRMLTFLPGKLFAKFKPHTSEILQSIGRFVGKLSQTLSDFSHPAATRDFYWDLKHAASTIRKYRNYISDSEKKKEVDYFLYQFEDFTLPQLPKLRKSIVHHDTNDYNLIMKYNSTSNELEIGIVDFGDMVYTNTVFEVVIAATYAALGKSNPLSAAAQVIKGYHSVFPLSELEIQLLFSLICTRLATSISVAAYQMKLEPDNEYLSISQEQVWGTLQHFRKTHPRFATYTFRHACGLSPCPHSSKVVEWLQQNKDTIGSIVDIDFSTSKFAVIDLSVGSLEFETPSDFTDFQYFSEVVTRRMNEENADIGLGRYNEPRLIYSGDQYSTSTNYGSESRTIHLAIDLFLTPGRTVYAPFDGCIHSFKNNNNPYDNGPTIIIEHDAGDTGHKFYTLFAHLSESSLVGISKGKEIKKGDFIGKVGSYPTNGGWPPHLHFQLIMDIFNWEGDFFGVAPPSQRDIWLGISPNPNLILRIPDDVFPVRDPTHEEILKIRNRRIGKNLTISYKKPLKIVRGFMQHLYDDEGRVYLDCRNNVPHVGHSNPSVVGALSKQAAVLNTNTRYLQSQLVQFADRICDTLPEPLNVCFFINSGSEANELALRLARTHTNQRDLIVIDGSYHGNTSTLVDISPYKYDGLGGKGPASFVHKVRTPDTYRGDYRGEDPVAGEKYAKDVLDIITNLKEEGKGFAAFICEPIMGSWGQIVFPENYLKEAFRYTREAGGVCIADEVQVGFGRVGTHFWGFETQGVVPDIVTMGKSIGNGHPLGAVVTTPEIAQSFDNGMEFFSTTGGNTVSCAVGIAVLDEIQNKKLQKNALIIGNYFLSRLNELKQKHQLIGDVRGLGLFIGVELVLDRETLKPATKEANYVVERLRELGILVGTDGQYDNVLKIKPPIIYKKQDVNLFIECLDSILSEDFVKKEDSN
jgi:4-aminobutyrate aminotransferase-like enzyme/Ser/Thr protein kinase RdoA (MazF antagonist)